MSEASSYFYRPNSELLITLAFVSSENDRSLTHVSLSLSFSLPLCLSSFPCLTNNSLCQSHGIWVRLNSYSKDKRWAQALKIAELNTESWTYRNLECKPFGPSENILRCYNSIMLMWAKSSKTFLYNITILKVL